MLTDKKFFFLAKDGTQNEFSVFLSFWLDESVNFSGRPRKFDTMISHYPMDCEFLKQSNLI